MKVLLQRSHHDPTRADGWSGAPGEATFIRNEIIDHLVPLLTQRGISVTIINGDYNPTVDTDQTWKARTPNVLLDYDLFLSTHYEANVHRRSPVDPTFVGGWFADRAAASPTWLEDDRFLGILRTLYRQIPGVPNEHQEWTNPNVTNYYAFRCTSAVTPGVLIELGVGAPGAPDHDWLRANNLRIAGVLASSIYQFLGLEDTLSQAEVDAINDHTDAKFSELYGAIRASQRRQMRGLDPWTDTPGDADDRAIAATEQINPSNGRG